MAEHDENMVERVAQAIKRASYPHCSDNEEITEPWRRKARAAIAAMRDETSHQYSHGTQALNVGGNAADVWKTMIDAALNEG